MSRLWASIVKFILGAFGAVGAFLAWRRIVEPSTPQQPPSKPVITPAQLQALEQQHVIAVSAKKREIEALKSDLESNLDAVNALETQIEALNKALEQGYKDSGMSAEDMVKAFEGLKL